MLLQRICYPNKPLPKLPLHLFYLYLEYLLKDTWAKYKCFELTLYVRYVFSMSTIVLNLSLNIFMKRNLAKLYEENNVTDWIKTGSRIFVTCFDFPIQNQGSKCNKNSHNFVRRFENLVTISQIVVAKLLCCIVLPAVKQSKIWACSTCEEKWLKMANERSYNITTKLGYNCPMSSVERKINGKKQNNYLF